MGGEIQVHNLKKIRSDVSVILCSGFSKQLMIRTAQDVGVEGILMQPVTLSALSEEVCKVLVK